MSADDCTFWQHQKRLPLEQLLELVCLSLQTRTYLCANAFSPTDIEVFLRLSPLLAGSHSTRPCLERWLQTVRALASSPQPNTSALEDRVARLEAVVGSVQRINFPSPELPAEVARVEAALCSLPGCALVQVPEHYYSLALRERAKLLRVPVGALCKTLVFENPAGMVVGDPLAPLPAQRYIAVVLQYTHKLSLAALCKAAGGASLALAKDGAALTGFAHNGVSPFGSLTHLPIVVSRGAVDCGHPAIFLGGGHKDVKARVFVGPLLKLPFVSVLGVSESRPEAEWE
jgi:prolyl-tRNA editing enzyme YbaK/EbsC (Cys-tRNA(Pro) deacylase)